MNKEITQKVGGLRGFLLPVASLCLGLVVFAGTVSLADREESVLQGVSGGSVESDSASSAASIPEFLTKREHDSGRERKAAPTADSQSQEGTDPGAVELDGDETVMHVGRVISSTPVASSGNAAASRARGNLALGVICDCDQDCDGGAPGADACNIVQCIVRSLCDNPPPGTAVPCADAEDCINAGAGLTCVVDPFNCDTNDPTDCKFVQRCAIVQLLDWPCDDDADFCTSDLCEDDGLEVRHSVCVAQDDGSGSPLSACPKQCQGGPANDLRCSKASDCSQGSCKITAGGGCDTATEACFVGASLATSTGRCCTAGACTETDESSCAGEWYRYSDPEEQEGDGNCLCPKYGSGIAPAGPDSGSSAAFGLIRPSGLMCDSGSRQDVGIIYCEDIDGDGLSPNFCQKRCVGGDNEGAGCEVDNPDCARLGVCSTGGTSCLVEEKGDDCGLCEGLDPPVGCDAAGGFFPCPGGETCLFEGGQDCPPNNTGTCTIDHCVSNDIEGGCENGFLNIGDDYALTNDPSFLRLSQFRFRGGVSNLGEDIIIEFWNSAATRLVDAFVIPNLGRTGTRDWAIEVDCWPNCNVLQLEVPVQNPIIIPSTGYVVMRSTRTVGTLNGAGAFWEQTDDVDTVGSNDETKAWVNGDPNGSLGTNVFIFELVGTKISDPSGACCTDAVSCADTFRWECGICSLTDDPPVLCASTLNDCPNGFLTGNICEFNNWFGPISHDEIEFGGAELTLCGPGVSPCDKGACCVGVEAGTAGEDCQLLTEEACIAVGGVDAFQGIATDCTPNCCPVDFPTGSDCACPTGRCKIIADGTLTTRICDEDTDCDAGQTCEILCTPAGVTQLRHPFECIDNIGSPVEPRQDCDPVLNGADCIPITCAVDEDCPTGFCDVLLLQCEDTIGMTCEQSFTGAFVVARNDRIPDVADLFLASEGELCSLNTVADRVGWFELINLPDTTPGDAADDCFKLTVGLCCTRPVLSPIWPFLSSFKNCPCIVTSDVIGQAPDFDIAGNELAGFGANSRASEAGRCEDTNYSATFSVPPGEYAYQINSDTSCAASIIGCDSDDDCPGTSCIIPNQDYSVVFTVESCQVAACCVGAECILTNKLDCEEKVGNFLGGGDQPIVTCQAGACSMGSCCVEGECNDQEFGTFGPCEAAEGIYLGGLTCLDDPCPACPFNTPANCQQVQTIFGRVPIMDRNPDNYGGASDPVKAGASMHADDVKFGGSQVDQICWNNAFFTTPCCGGGCTPNIDGTWEIRIYGPDPNCEAVPGPEIGMSSITVLNKIAGTGQGANNWHYSGKLLSSIPLPNGGLAGDTYWFEITAFGESGCEVRATWSRDHGNEHIAQTVIANENDDRVYKLKNVEEGPDLGFCENSGIATPDTILGSCCTCPGNCQDNLASQSCDLLGGFWTACASCAETLCGEAPANNDCGNAQVVTNVPTSDDGSAFISIAGENICATDDGPPVSDDDSDPDLDRCLAVADSVPFGMHDDVWYSYVATDCGDLRITSCDTTDQDMMIAIYNGSACPVLTSDELACDLNGCADFFDSDVTRRVVPNQELLIRIGGLNNEVAGGFDGDPRGTWTTQWSLTTGVCEAVLPPVRALPPDDILKNRYISVIPRGAKGVNPDFHHIGVTVFSSEVAGLNGSGPWWAGDPDADCISVVTTTKPEFEPDWAAAGCPVVHLTGCPMVPTTTYGIFAESGGLPSVEELLDTQAKPGSKWHGDVVGSFDGTVWSAPNGVVNITDAQAVIKTFIVADFAADVTRTDVHPNLKGDHNNRLINANDILVVILGFKNQEYPEPDLTLCP